MVISRTRTSAVVIKNDKLLTFRAIDPVSGKEYLFLPGGAVEPNETAPEAAERETLEETGYKIKVDELSAIDREYFFDWKGDTFDCLTIFYKGHLTSPFAAPVHDADYNKGVEWLDLSEIPSAFDYSAEIKSAILELSK
jgi:tRNA(adenine34) deaminase